MINLIFNLAVVAGLVALGWHLLGWWGVVAAVLFIIYVVIDGDNGGFPM
jgi:hypothetical protein